MNFKKVGGLLFFRVGRLGGSFYVAKAESASVPQWVVEMVVAMAIGLPLGAAIASRLI